MKSKVQRSALSKKKRNRKRNRKLLHPTSVPASKTTAEHSATAIQWARPRPVAATSLFSSGFSGLISKNHCTKKTYSTRSNRLFKETNPLRMFFLFFWLQDIACELVVEHGHLHPNLRLGFLRLGASSKIWEDRFTKQQLWTVLNGFFNSFSIAFEWFWMVLNDF